MSLKEKIEQKITAYKKAIMGNLVSGAWLLGCTLMHWMVPGLAIGMGAFLALGIAACMIKIRKLRRIMRDPLFYVLAIKRDLDAKLSLRHPCTRVRNERQKGREWNSTTSPPGSGSGTAPRWGRLTTPRRSWCT